MASVMFFTFLACVPGALSLPVWPEVVVSALGSSKLVFVFASAIGVSRVVVVVPAPLATMGETKGMSKEEREAEAAKNAKLKLEVDALKTVVNEKTEGLKGKMAHKAPGVGNLPAMKQPECKRTVTTHLKKVYCASWNRDSLHMCTAGQVRPPFSRPPLRSIDPHNFHACACRHNFHACACRATHAQLPACHPPLLV